MYVEETRLRIRYFYGELSENKVVAVIAMPCVAWQKQSALQIL